MLYERRQNDQYILDATACWIADSLSGKARVERRPDVGILDRVCDSLDQGSGGSESSSKEGGVSTHSCKESNGERVTKRKRIEGPS